MVRGVLKVSRRPFLGVPLHPETTANTEKGRLGHPRTPPQIMGRHGPRWRDVFLDLRAGAPTLAANAAAAGGLSLSLLLGRESAGA